MTSKDRPESPSAFELRAYARQAGVGTPAAPAPVRLDDLRREIMESQARIARLPRIPSAKAS